MTDFKYGDLVCYRAVTGTMPHDGPVMVVRVLTHKDAVASPLPTAVPGDLRLMPLGDGLNLISQKDPSMWQKCEHLDD